MAKKIDPKQEMNKIALKATEIVNDFWVASLKEMKGYPISDDLIEGLRKLSKSGIEDAIKAKLKS